MKKHRKMILFSMITALLFSVTGCNDYDKNAETAVTEKTEQQSLADASSTTGNTAEVSDDKPNAPVSVSNVDGKRAYHTQLKGNGEDVVTLMVYLCGSNLESNDGAATLDLTEMKSANISENLNVVIETGGATEWLTEGMEPSLNQRWQLTNEGYVLLESIDAQKMSDGGTLRDFVKYSADNFPADRYMLLLWDHGGGTIDGYAYDERFEDESMMSLPDLDNALAEAGVKFDMIGFDCCLMGTAEIAFMAEKHADYMVASQREEPGSGWEYTSLIDALSANTSIPTAELGKVIVDGFIEHNVYDSYWDGITLSVVDLTYIPSLFDSMYSFFSEIQGSLANGDFFVQTLKTVGNSRAMQSDCDLVDMEYLLKSIDNSEELQDKLSECIVYNETTIENYSGLCLYFPYNDLEKVDEALEIYKQIGIDEKYSGFISECANLMLGGQAFSSGSSGSPYGGDEFDSDYWSGLDWTDEEKWDSYSDYYSYYSYDDSELVITEKGDGFVLSLSDEEWALITEKNLRVFMDDGEGYLDLGSDGIYKFDGDGDLLIQFDYTWVALDGMVVCFYQEDSYEDGDDWYSYGVVPVLYEGEEAELVVVWDSDYPDGYVEGWRYTHFGGGAQRGLFDLKDGMVFDLIGDYYYYDLYPDDSYIYDTLTVDGEVIVSYEEVPDTECIVYYELYDIFQNSYWTESVVY